jgi:biotin-(acetyl-CoA carboxylase) ligase
VIGIGINVNNMTKNLEEGGANPIALADIVDSVVNREDFLHLLLKNLGDVWNSPNAVTAAPADWDTWCLLRGKAVVVERSEGRLSGICRGIDSSGNLLVEETFSPNEPPRLHPLASVKNIRWE